jgi:hypothetical protein
LLGGRKVVNMRAGVMSSSYSRDGSLLLCGLGDGSLLALDALQRYKIHAAYKLGEEGG